MGVAITLREYLEDLDVAYDVVEHSLDTTSLGIARQAHVPSSCLAKGVLLRDENGVLTLAVIPADRVVDLERVRGVLRHEVRIAPESDVIRKFDDCDRGAVPPVGNAYAVRVLLDDHLKNEEEVYLEAGDHQGLVHVKGGEFRRLMGGATGGVFSRAI